MKAVLINLLVVICCTHTFGQARKTTTQSKTTTVNRRTNPANTTTTQRNTNTQTAGAGNQQVQPRQTITEKRLNGSEQNGLNRGGETNSKETPFVGGVHASPNAGRTFDTITPPNNANRSIPAGVQVAAGSSNANVNNQSSNQGGTHIAGGNDTTFNANTTNEGTVNTNSGAVDRSGQAQFGQTNWGRNNRNTVGESQWTVPPPITASFNKQFPEVSNAQWTRNNGDTSIYDVRYKAGANWASSRYSASGERLDTRVDIPLVQAPRPVSVFLAKQPDNFRITSITRLQMQGKPEVFEIRTANGKTIYINNDGMETQL